MKDSEYEKTVVTNFFWGKIFYGLYGRPFLAGTTTVELQLMLFLILFWLTNL